MKLTKRIIALMIVLCTIGAMMIPGVSVSAAKITVKYDFHAAGVAYGTDWLHTPTNGTPSNLKSAYVAGNSNFMFDSTNAMQSKFQYLKVDGTSYYPMYYAQSGTLADWEVNFGMAIRVKAPATAEYTMDVTYLASSDPSTVKNGGAFIWEVPAEKYDAANNLCYQSNNGSAYRGNATALYSNIATRSSEEAVVTFNPYDSTVAAVTATDNGDFRVAQGTKTFNLVEGTEYVIVIYGQGYAIDSASAGQKQLLYVKDLSLNYAEQEIVWDPKNNTDLVVDFVDAPDYDITTNANIATDKWVTGNVPALDAAYESGANKWTIYRNDGTNIYSLYAAKNYTPGYLGLYSSEKEADFNTFGYLPLLIKAPGTADYILSVTDSAVKWADKVDVTAHVFAVPEEGFTKATLKAAADSATPLIQYNTIDDKPGQVVGTSGVQKTFTAETAVALEGGKDYVVVLGIKGAASQQKAYIRGFALTEVKAEAVIEGKFSGSLVEAIAAANGDTIMLNTDVTAADAVDLGDAVLDLNGKTLTAPAVVGTVCDFSDGNGLIATAKESIITAAAGQVALWDNNEQAPGYRVFNYEFVNYGVSEDEDDTTGVSKVIDFYDYERSFLAKSFDENGEVARGAGDYKFKNVAVNIREDYNAGNTSWRYEYCSSTYQMSRGGQNFSWGNKSIAQFGAGYTAIRIMAPADGKVSVALKTSSKENTANNGAFDMYIVKASDVEALCTDYDAAHEAYVNALPSAADKDSGACTNAELGAAFTAAIAANDAVLSGVSDGNTYNGAFEFEAGEEYILIFNMSEAKYLNFQNIKFYRAEKKGMTQSFWSTLKFDNAKAYTLINTKESGLKVGFEMDWNGAEKAFECDDATLAAWAKDQGENANKTFGLYLRVGGFEKLAESGVLTGKAYLINGAATAYAEGDALTYNYEA